MGPVSSPPPPPKRSGCASTVRGVKKAREFIEEARKQAGEELGFTKRFEAIEQRLDAIEEHFKIMSEI
jgi:hypothetical protein